MSFRKIISLFRKCEDQRLVPDASVSFNFLLKILLACIQFLVILYLLALVLRTASNFNPVPYLALSVCADTHTS